MATLFVEKVVSALPSSQQANTIYFVRTGAGFDIHVTDSTAAFAHRLNPPLSWGHLKDHWDAAPAHVGEVTDPVPGKVWSYRLGGVTRYRLQPTPYAPQHDAFYSSFSGEQLTGLIAARG